MKIHVVDGSISFAQGTICRKQKRVSFLASDLGRDATTRVVNEIWWHVGIRPEPGIAATLIFKLDQLDSVLLLMKIPSDQTGQWTTETELERKGVHDRWLDDELGQPPYEYEWGVVASEFDSKGCVSEIIVAYAK